MASSRVSLERVLWGGVLWGRVLWGGVLWPTTCCRMSMFGCGTVLATSNRNAARPLRGLQRLRATWPWTRSKREAARSLAHVPQLFERPSGDGASASQERNEELRGLKRCVNGLAPQKREMVLLAYHFGMTWEQVANRVDRPVARVKTWRRRSLAELKECLGQ